MNLGERTTPLGKECYGHIYVVTNDYLECEGIYKIGYTKQPVALRVARMNDTAAIPVLKFRAVKTFGVACPRKVEAHLHLEYKSVRETTTKKVEWFKLCAEDLATNIPNKIKSFDPGVCSCTTERKRKSAESQHALIKQGRKQGLVTYFAKNINGQMKALSFVKFCLQFGIDLENDKRNAFFWNTRGDKEILISPEVLRWCGYSGPNNVKKQTFLRLLNKNIHMKYHKVKGLIQMNYLDFESLIMQMKSSKAIEIREIFSRMKYISELYIRNQERRPTRNHPSGGDSTCMSIDNNIS